MQERHGGDTKPAFDGPRADSSRAMREMSVGVGTTSPHVECLGFDEALGILRRGGRVARAGWNGKGQFLALQVPDFNSKMTLPYIYIRTVQGDLVPWLASQTDLLAFDWCLVREEKVLVYGHGTNAE